MAIVSAQLSDGRSAFLSDGAPQPQRLWPLTLWRTARHRNNLQRRTGGAIRTAGESNQLLPRTNSNVQASRLPSLLDSRDEETRVSQPLFKTHCQILLLASDVSALESRFPTTMLTVPWANLHFLLSYPHCQHNEKHTVSRTLPCSSMKTTLFITGTRIRADLRLKG